MEIEEVKTWQWLLAGLIVGFAFSGIVAWTGPTFDTQARDTIEQGEFENATFALTKFGQLSPLIREYHKDTASHILPLLRDVMVHPPVASDPTHSYWVTGRSYFVGLKPVDPTKINGPEKIYEEWRPFKYPAKAPYLPGYTLREEKKLDKNANRNRELADLKKALGDQATFPTVTDYLKSVAKMPDASFKFQFAWWELPKALWTLPPLAGLLMVGIAWPLALSVMQNFGVTKAPPVKTAAPATPARKPIRATATPGVVLTPAVGGPLPPVDTKQYGGEFYPVVKTTNKE